MTFSDRIRTHGTTRSMRSRNRQSITDGASGALVSIFNAESKFGSVEDYKKYTRPYDKRVFDALADTRLTVLHLHFLERPYLDQRDCRNHAQGECEDHYRRPDDGSGLRSTKCWRPAHNCSCWSARSSRKRKNEPFDATSSASLCESKSDVPW